MNTVRVSTSKEYNIHIGKGILSDIGEMLKNEFGVCTVAVITDDIVDSLYSNTVISSLEKSGFRTLKYVFPHGEESKTINTYASILSFLAENEVTRSDILLSLGGGVVGDTGGFAAATYSRGIKSVQVPTTLLAAVDSSVGGKTAVNLPSGKNLAGAFYQPDMVICDYSVIDTLPEEFFADGCAEVIKYGIIGDYVFFEFLRNNDIKENLKYVITRCVEMKRDIVNIDEKDNGIRAILNFGHTIGHAIEKCSNYTVSHGRAIAIGMVIASKSAYKKGYCDTNISEEIKEVLIKNSLPISCDFTAEELFGVALSDKKRNGDIIKLIIPEKTGKCVCKNIHASELLSFIKAGLG
ncbi:MAG: 3-dehydroquinate synthase [Clostridia bacterium]|nr:3-dehydroquinate synthase [Clostridia bacterium]